MQGEIRASNKVRILSVVAARAHGHGQHRQVGTWGVNDGDGITNGGLGHVLLLSRGTGGIGTEAGLHAGDRLTEHGEDVGGPAVLIEDGDGGADRLVR